MAKGYINITIANRLLCELVATLDSLIMYSHSKSLIDEAVSRRDYLMSLKDAGQLEYPIYSVSKRQRERTNRVYPKKKK